MQSSQGLKDTTLLVALLQKVHPVKKYKNKHFKKCSGVRVGGRDFFLICSRNQKIIETNQQTGKRMSHSLNERLMDYAVGEELAVKTFLC